MLSWGSESGFFPHGESVWRWDVLWHCVCYSLRGNFQTEPEQRSCWQNSEPKFNSWELLVRFMADTLQGPGTAAAWGGVAAQRSWLVLLVVLGGGGWLGTPASIVLGLTRKLLLLLLPGILPCLSSRDILGKVYSLSDTPARCRVSCSHLVFSCNCSRLCSGCANPCDKA